MGREKKRASEQAPGNKKSSGDIKAQVASELSTRLRQPVDGPEQLSSILRAVFASHKKDGLHSLAVKPTGPGEFDVLVSASKAEKEGSGRLEDTTKLRRKDLEVRVSPKTGKLTGVPGVALIARFNDVPLPRQESKGHNHHAEDGLIAYLRGHMNTLPRAPNGKDQLTVMITKSTCPRCGRRLGVFANDNNITVTLSLMGFYFGETQTNREFDRSFWATVGLRKKGFTLVVPTFEEVMRNVQGELDDASKKALIERLAYITPIVKVINDKTQALGGAGAA